MNNSDLSLFALLDALYLSTGNLGYNMLKHNIEKDPYKDYVSDNCVNNDLEM